MDNETYHESRSEQPTWFRAPSNLIECCMFCGLAIQPGELIAEVDDDEYLHESCNDEMAQREECRFAEEIDRRIDEKQERETDFDRERLEDQADREDANA